MKNSFVYGAGFYSSVEDRADFAANEVFRILRNYLGVESFETVVDVGCGPGVWSRSWIESGLAGKVKALDLSEAVERNTRQGSWRSIEFIAADFCDPQFALPGGNFALCTEVLEHLSSECADRLFDNMLKNYEGIIFSAGQPGQGGTHHVNERPLNYWVSRATMQGFEVFDIFREKLLATGSIPKFYAHNLMLILNPTSAASVELKAKGGVFATTHLVDYRTRFEKIRYALVGTLPHEIVTLISRFKKIK